ncbi:hypothetical protein GOP47_0012760 [Adiantum capillus-veneris]|uniref:Uncharacterized protein n=1 Tax=Adiantum capillus-veneris TaxID=13818 RepID=A0A9D4ZEQ1_ADICA|nr:hypothetical protein GOP47_0012760 [Adiantum capillus-veneris]
MEDFQLERHFACCCRVCPCVFGAEEGAISCARKFPGKEHVWKAWDSIRRRRGRRSAGEKHMRMQLHAHVVFVH